MDEIEGKELQFNEILNDFDDRVKGALVKMDYNYVDTGCVDIKRITSIRDGNIYICVENAGSYELYLVLKCIEEIDLDGEEEWKDVNLSKTGKGYSLEIIRYGEDPEENDTVLIPFTEARVEIKKFNYSRDMEYPNSGYEALWSMVAGALMSLRKKAEFNLDELNDMEKRLLPLTEFDPILSFKPILFFYSKPNDLISCTKEQYDLFSAYIHHSGCEEIQGLLDHWYNAKSQKERKKLRKKIKSELTREEAFPVWKLIQNDIEKACKEYPLEVECTIEKDRIEILKTEIEHAMHNYGFQGTYPSFRHKAIKGKKELLSCIECYEEGYPNEICIKFLIGTRTLRSGQITYEKEQDVHIVFFKGKGKHLQYSMEMNLEAQKHSTRDEKTYIDQFCQVATKRALGLKLTKQERKSPWFDTTNLNEKAAATVILMMLAFGVIGAVLFTVGMMLLTLIIGFFAIIIFKKPMALLGELMLDSIWLKGLIGVFITLEVLAIILIIVTVISSRNSRE